MRRILDQGLRGAAAIVVLFGLAACGTGAGDDDGDGGGGGGSDAAPTVAISAPSDGADFASGASIAFAGSADDAEDGDLTASLTWTSNVGGAIGSGGSFSAELSDGTHVVTASATDSASQTATDTVTITVGDDGGGGGGGTGSAREVGFVAVEETRSDGNDDVVSAGGGFVQFDGDVPDAFFDDPWAQVVGTCDVFSVDDIPDDPTFGLPAPDGLGLTFLEAGASLSVTADGAAFLELDRFEGSFGGQTLIAYTTGEAVVGTADGALALTVPGDEFPAVSDAAFPSTAPFELTAPAAPGTLGSVSEATTFTWTGATDDAATIVAFDLVSDDFMTSVSCTAPDTGSFELPAATITELGGSFSGRVASAGRESVRVETVGDARLLLSLSRSQEYDLVLF